MCLYPRKMTNRKYVPTAKNGGHVPSAPLISGRYEIFTDIDKKGNETKIVRDNRIFDTRVMEIEIPCGQCIECRQQNARQWRIRLNEELPEWKYKYFLTLSFAPEELGELEREFETISLNFMAKKALRRMCEYYRKEHGKSIRHWFVTELGHENSERIHLHGIIFSQEPITYKIIEYKPNEGWRANWKYWKYGEVFVGQYCSERTINYIVKYVTKIDEDHKDYKSLVLCSPGIGRSYVEKNSDKFTYKPKNSRLYYVQNNGCKVSLGQYYKNHFYNEEEREKIWREFMDEDKTTIYGNTIKNTTNLSIQKSMLNKAREENINYGYGTDSKEWRKKDYNLTEKMLKKFYEDKFAYKGINYLRPKKTKKLQKNAEKFGYIKNLPYLCAVEYDILGKLNHN